MGARRQRVEERTLLEPQPLRRIGNNGKHADKQHEPRKRVADDDEIDEERDRRDGGGDERWPVHPRVKKRALNSALARVAQVRFVVEDVIDAVHRQVVRHQEEDRAEHKGEVDHTGGQIVRRRKRKGGVNPAQGARGKKQVLKHGDPPRQAGCSSQGQCSRSRQPHARGFAARAAPTGTAGQRRPRRHTRSLRAERHR